MIMIVDLNVRVVRAGEEGSGERGPRTGERSAEAHRLSAEGDRSSALDTLGELVRGVRVGEDNESRASNGVVVVGRGSRVGGNDVDGARDALGEDSAVVVGLDSDVAQAVED